MSRQAVGDVNAAKGQANLVKEFVEDRVVVFPSAVGLGLADGFGAGVGVYRIDHRRRPSHWRTRGRSRRPFDRENRVRATRTPQSRSAGPRSSMMLQRFSVIKHLGRLTALHHGKDDDLRFRCTAHENQSASAH